MIHQFSTFEIDEAKRELRVGGRVLTIQPRVFDVLAYLAQNRERVVPKDELLDSVWPGVIVTDASLQRAISLARAALADAGADDAIKTHARQGYRLCGDADQNIFLPPSPSPDPAAMLSDARAAYERGDWAAVLAAMQQADALQGLGAEDLQRCAHAAQCAGEPNAAMPLLERAVAAYGAKGDRRNAAWVALLLAHLRLEWREPILAKGWLHRTERLLRGEPPCREKGYLAFVQARLALMANDAPAAMELANAACRAGEEFNDPDLHALGLIHLGEAQLYLGRIAEGLAAIDEAGASVVASDVSSWAGGLVYCGVIYSCMSRSDWDRAAQWTSQFTRWCDRRGAASYPGLCRMHRAEVLTVRGDLRQAEREIRATLEMLARNAPWAEGDAWRVLGDILLARGDFAGARQAFERANELGWETHFNLALLRFAEGDAVGAESLLARSIASDAWSCRSRRGQALAHYAMVAASAGHLEKARSALAVLAAQPELTSTSALQALVAQARGELAALEGRVDEAIACWRGAVRSFQEMDAPLSAAQVRCRLADVQAQAGDHEGAAMERAAAQNAFEQAGAEGLLRNCARGKRASEKSLHSQRAAR